MQNQEKSISSTLGLRTAFILVIVLLMEFAAQVGTDVFSLPQALWTFVLYAAFLYTVDLAAFGTSQLIRRPWFSDLYFSSLLAFSVFLVGGAHLNKHLIPWRIYQPPSIIFNVFFLAACSFLGYALFLAGRRGRYSALQAPKGKPLSALFLCVRGAALATVLLAVASSGRETASLTGQRHGKPLNVFILVVDALRPDHLSCYGYDRPTSPRISELAADGTLFRNAYAHANWTVTSVATLLTGIHPAVHQVFGTENRLPEQAETVAEILKGNGWRTGFFTGLQVIGSEIGFCQGADKIYPPPLTEPAWFFGGHTALEQAWRRLLPLTKGITRGSYNAEELVASALEWLGEVESQPVFAYMHFNEPHWPYTPPPPYNGLFSDKPLKGRTDIKGKDQTVEMLEDSMALYDGEIAYADFEIGNLMDSLKQMHLYDDSLIIVTADHGEEFYEHEGWEHGRTLYEETVYVPLIVKPPSGSRRVGGSELLCGSMDILPTILDYAGIEHPEAAGRSLRPAIEDEKMEPLPVISSASDSSSTYPYLNSIRTPEFTLIEDRRNGLKLELYSRTSDRGEKENLVEENPEKTALLHGVLTGEIREKVARSYKKEFYEVSQKRLRVLKALGYLE